MSEQLSTAAAVLQALQRPRTREGVVLRTGLHPATAYRMIQALVAMGWVREVREVSTAHPGRRAVVYEATVRIVPRGRRR